MYLKVITTVMGGVGLFLLGMVLMIEGLKTIAGDRLRHILHRFTGTRISSIISGAFATAMVQSSSATTVVTLGFVSAGLITFLQAIGIIFGANLGATSTSWIVTMLGLKLKIGLFAFPMVFCGALMRLLGKEKIAVIGYIIAGFGLIFVGIDIMQAGMMDIARNFNPARFIDVGLLGRFILTLFGIAMTVVMQSSGAAVATTLTALHTGTITIEHAAALVIGQNIGTTFKVVIAAVGAPVPTRRTALSHVMFNVIIGGIAFAIFPVFIIAVKSLTSMFGTDDPAITLSVFHTVFNFVGVILFFPFLRPFANAIERIIPEKRLYLTRRLDDTVLSVNSVAIEAARLTLLDILTVVLKTVKRLLLCTSTETRVIRKLENVDLALAETRQFINNVHSQPEIADVYVRHIAMLHAVEHIGILSDACKEYWHEETLADDENLQGLALSLSDKIVEIRFWVKGQLEGTPPVNVENTSIEMTNIRKREREIILEKTAGGEIASDLALEKIEVIRWLDRMTYRTWRAVHYLQGQNGK